MGNLFQQGGIETEEVGMEDPRDAEELTGVDILLVENLVDGAGGDTDLLGQPQIGLLLPSQFLADKMPDVRCEWFHCSALLWQGPSVGWTGFRRTIKNVDIPYPHSGVLGKPVLIRQVLPTMK